jgi:hypothetical protein
MEKSKLEAERPGPQKASALALFLRLQGVIPILS